MANRGELRSLVIEATARGDKVSLINDALDFGLRRISAARLWSDLLIEATATLASGANTVTLAAETERITGVRVIDGSASRSIQIRMKSWLRQRFPNPSTFTAGKPVWAYIVGTTLHIIPTADQDYTIETSYFRTEPAFANDAATANIVGIDDVLVAYANFWVFMSVQQMEMSQQWLQIYNGLLLSAIETDQSDHVIRVQADIRGARPVQNADYWLDPFVRETPGGYGYYY